MINKEQLIRRAHAQEAREQEFEESINGDGITSETLQNKAMGVRSQIEELQRELNPSPTATFSGSASSYLDEYGQETWFVKNISGAHIVISDIPDMNKIERGKCVDLLQMSDIETIKKSRDLKMAMSGIEGRTSLVRITPQEYIIYLKDEIESKKKINALRDTMEPKKEGSENKTESVRPVILAKIEKLRLSSDKDPEVATKGITVLEFAEWLSAERLSEDEIDVIMGMVNDRTVRNVLIKKKQEILK